MRMGAIFARGSCGVLKWTAVLGSAFAVAFTLGAGEAAAQDQSLEEGEFSVAVEDVDEGASATITVTLNAKVKANIATTTTVLATVTVAMDPDGENTPAEPTDHVLNPSGAVSFTFPKNENDAPTDLIPLEAMVTLQTTQDPDAENDDIKVTVAIDGASAAKFSGTVEDATKDATIKDDETQEYVLTVNTESPKEGAPIMLTLKAMPEHDDDSETLSLHLDDPDYTLSPDEVTLDGSNNSQVITVTPPDNDKNRVEDTVTLTVHSGRPGNSEERDRKAIKVADIHELPAVTAAVVDEDGDLDPQPESVMEGDTIMVVFTAVDEDGEPMKADEDLEISLVSTGTADSRDYRLDVHPIDIATGDESSDAVELTIAEDEDVNMEMLVFDASVAGDGAKGDETRTVMGVLSLAIDETPADERHVAAKPQDEVQAAVYDAMEAGAGEEGLNPGESFDLMASDLFDSADGVTVAYSAESDDRSVADTSESGGMVTVSAMAEGMAQVTITATATTPSGVEIVTQTRTNVAQIQFPVTVALEDLVVSLSGPEDTNIPEGESAMLTAMANRPVVDDTMVELILVGGDASPADYTAEPITIMAGETMGTTMVMAVVDDDTDAETLTLQGRVGTLMTNEVTFTIWDAAVPALPVIAQLLLAAFLAIGGYRRYLRR